MITNIIILVLLVLGFLKTWKVQEAINNNLMEIHKDIAKGIKKVKNSVDDINARGGV